MERRLLTDEPILAAYSWKTNAGLIEACAQLGYLRAEWLTLDPTFGKHGGFWKKWAPSLLTTHYNKEDGSDFRWLPYPDNAFDAIVYDPPYTAKGGRETSGILEMDDRFGQIDCPATPTLLQELINDGLTEMWRLVKPGGNVLAKCQSYVSGGKMWPGRYLTAKHAFELGFELIDEFQMIGSLRPQPKRSRSDGEPVYQQHSRQNYSTLYVFQKPKKQRSANKQGKVQT